MEVRHAHTAGKSRNLRIVPRHRKKDWRVAENAEIVSVVGVLPDVFAGEDQVFPESLLKSSMEFIAPAGTQRRYAGCRAAQEWI